MAMIDNSLRTAVNPVARIALPWLGVVLAAIFSGTLAAGNANSVLGQKPALLLLGALVAGSFLVMFLYLGSSAVLVWPVAATGGYLLQVPRGHVVLTFDRVWIFGLLAYIAVSGRRMPRTPATRLLVSALFILVASFGLRALTTSVGTEPVKVWVDSIVLPAVLFVACERYCLPGADRGRRLAGSLMIAGGILGLIGIAERLWGFELATLSGGSARFDAAIDTTRVSGPYPAPEPYALTLAICLAATLYWVNTRSRGSRSGWGLALVGVQGTAIALALFRAGWLAAILVVIAAFGYRPGRFGRTFAVVGLVGVVALAASLQLQSNSTVSERLNNTENIKQRLAIYKQGIEIFRTAPVFGVGVDQYNAVAQNRPPATVSGVESQPWPHSTYFGALAEQGIVGFIPVLLLSYAVWRVIAALRALSFRSREATLLLGAVTGAALAYFVMSLTLTMLPYEASNTFFFAFLGGASGRLDALERETQPPSAPA
jgi:O-antigen ligase